MSSIKLILFVAAISVAVVGALPTDLGLSSVTDPLTALNGILPALLMIAQAVALLTPFLGPLLEILTILLSTISPLGELLSKIVPFINQLKPSFNGIEAVLANGVNTIGSTLEQNQKLMFPILDLIQKPLVALLKILAGNNSGSGGLTSPLSGLLNGAGLGSLSNVIGGAGGVSSLLSGLTGGTGTANPLDAANPLSALGSLGAANPLGGAAKPLAAADSLPASNPLSALPLHGLGI